MKRAQLTLFLIGLILVPLLGQTAQKIADINRKIVGKWVTSDGKATLNSWRTVPAQTVNCGPMANGTLKKARLALGSKGRSFPVEAELSH